MKPPIEAIRFKSVREELEFTQSAFAIKLSLTGAVADLERGRTKMAGYIVTRLLELFQINPLWLFGKSEQKYLRMTEREVSPQVLTIDSAGQENILMINQKASAGYADNINDPEFVDSLPIFTFPIPEFRNATFRCFQIEGDSMQPAVQPGDWIIAQALESLDDVKNSDAYIIVDDSSVRFKNVKIDNHSNELTLLSLNPEYHPDTLNFDQVRELWRFHSKLSFELQTDSIQLQLERIYQGIQEVKEKLG